MINDLNIGGFGSFLLGLNKKTYEQAGIDTPGNVPGSYIEPGLGWMTGFLFVTSFVGLLALIPLRKVSTLCFLSSTSFKEIFDMNFSILLFADYDHRL